METLNPLMSLRPPSRSLHLIGRLSSILQTTSTLNINPDNYRNWFWARRNEIKSTRYRKSSSIIFIPQPRKMTLPFGMRLYLMIFLIGMAGMTLGQATYFLTGGAAAGVTENNYAELKLPAAYEGRFIYSNNLGILRFRYNIGASFVQDVWAGHPSVTAGISGVFMKPSGFIKAQTAEDVTYITNKWYLSVDINSVHAAIPVDDSWVYQWGIEPAVVIGRPISKKVLFILSPSYRLNYSPAYVSYGEVTSWSGLFLHAGLMYSPGPKRYKP